MNDLLNWYCTSFLFNLLISPSIIPPWKAACLVFGLVHVLSLRDQREMATWWTEECTDADSGTPVLEETLRVFLHANEEHKAFCAACF